MQLSFQRLFFTLGFITLFVFVMIQAQSLLMPLAMALLIAFIMLPLCRRLEGWGLSRTPATFLAVLSVLGLLIGLFYYFSSQLVRMMSELELFRERVLNTISDATVFVNENIPFVADLNRQEILANLEERLLGVSGSLVQSTFSSTSSLLTGVVTTLLFTIFFLLYRGQLVRAMVGFSASEDQVRTHNMLRRVQRVGQSYLGGMFTLILILGTINSLGLWIIGVDSPFFFGFFAASLSIIPYLGTLLGAVIPILYTFLSQDALWMPLAVAALFVGVQTLEGYVLSPKVVGDSLNVNPFAAFLSLLAGALVWGVGGVVLFLPYTAMLMVASEEFVQLKPLAVMIGEEHQESDDAESSKPSVWQRVKSVLTKKGRKESQD